MFVNWSRIVESLQDRRIIPIIGSDALPVVLDGEIAPFHEFLARELCLRLRKAGKTTLDPIPTNLPELTRAVCQLPENRERARNLVTDDLREHLKAAHHELLARVQPAPETEALRVFAELPLILTTSIDAGIEVALRKVCGCPPTSLNLKRITSVTLEDLPDGWEAPRGKGTAPRLYHLLGRIDRRDTFVLTDDELIECLWKLQGNDAPKRLCKALADQDILLLGSAFPDWLLRFVLRLARGRAFTKDVELSFGLIAEKHLCSGHTLFDSALYGFLSQLHSCNVWLYGEDHPARFLAQLQAKVDVELTMGAPEPPAFSIPRTARKANGTIFISYSRANTPFAQRLEKELKQRCPVWFDEQELRGGEELTPELNRAIENAHLFIPLISRETNCAAGPHVFVSEWKKAIEVAKKIQSHLRPYIVPVIIDDLPHSELAGEAAKFSTELGLTSTALCPRLGETDSEQAFKRLLDDLEVKYRTVELALRGQRTTSP